MSTNRRRVKVYTLNDDRQWDDRGTGHVVYAFVESLGGLALEVRNEEDGKRNIRIQTICSVDYIQNEQ